MAGIAKPDNDILIGTKTEMTDYTIGDSYVHGSSSVQGLFDEAAVNEWNTSNVCYLYDSNYYFIITFNKPVNIYRSGTQNWSEHYAKLNIYKLNENGDWEDITSSVEQTTSAITHQHWGLTIKNLDKGTYKFQATGPRLDSEWFLEEITTSSGGNTGEGDNTGSGTEEGGNTGDGTGEDNSGEDNTQENKGPSKVIKSTVKDVIVNNKLFQEHVSIQERDE